MADECTDVTTVEELSIFCRWNEKGVPVEHFMDIIPIKKTDASTIYSILVDFLQQKNIPLSKLVGMGFDGAATFSGKKTRVQSRLMYIATATCSSLLVFKLLTLLQELTTCTQHSLHYGNFSTIPLKGVSH